MATVLIVDDNEQNLYMLEILLLTHGFQVLKACQGVEALEVAKMSVPDLVIADILMPVMDGFSLCRHWKADGVLKTKPFVFYTATYTGAQDEEFALSLGADRFLVKPQPPERILEVVAELLAPPTADGPQGSAETETEFLQRYNQALFHKLEKKVADLEAANIALEGGHRQREELERQLVQAHKMESLGQLAGGIVHDFNNILTVIGGFASLIEMTPGDKEKTAEWGQRIQDAVRMGSGLGRQLLAFARRQDLALVSVDANDLLGQSLPLLKVAVGSGVGLAFSPGKGLPLVVADATQLQQVFLNLAANARDAVPPDNGTLTIETAWMDTDAEFLRHKGTGEPGRYVRIRFADNGCGIAPGVLEHIFEPFFTTKEPGQGTGLGLSVVYGIVRQHRGFLQVTSVVGRGTCFEVYLPAGK